MARRTVVKDKLLMSRALGKFILGQMEKRQMSARQFAAFVGLSASTINSYINGEDVDPSLANLRKLAKATNTPLVALIGLSYPDAILEMGAVDPVTWLLATELGNIPESLQDGIIALIRGQQGPRGDDKIDK